LKSKAGNPTKLSEELKKLSEESKKLGEEIEKLTELFQNWL